MSVQAKQKDDAEPIGVSQNDGNTLPEGWCWSTFGESTVNCDGRRVPIKSADRDRRSGPYPYYGASGIIDDIDDYLFDGEFLLIAEDGANLLSRSTPIAFRASGKFWVNNHAHVVEADEVAELGFVEHYLNSIDLTFYITGSAQPKLTQAALNQLRIPIAPLQEQRRIVSKLELLLGKVSSSQQRLSRIPRLLKRFRQSVLAAACSGKLTADWREENDILPSELVANEQYPDSWRSLEFSEVLDSIRSGTTAVPALAVTRFPVLRSSSVRPGQIDYADRKFLTEEQSQNDANFLMNGDLLFTRLSGSIEYVANCAQVRDLGGLRIQYPDRLFCARLKKPSQGRFFEVIFSAPQIRATVTEGAKSSAGHQRISLDNIRKQIVPMPPLTEQEEIVRRVEKLFVFADQIETRLQHSQTHVDRLTQSLLAKAFRGELVPTEAELARRESRDSNSTDTQMH